MLSDKEIIDAIKSGEIQIKVPFKQNYIDAITPSGVYKDCHGALQGHGYDLFVGRYRKLNSDEPWQDNKKVVFQPGESLEIETYQKLGLRPSICATAHAMVRIGLIGLYPTLGTIHPGWGEDDPQALEVVITNFSDHEVFLEAKTAFVRIMFHRLQVPTELPPPDLSELHRLAQRQRQEQSDKLQKEKEKLEIEEKYKLTQEVEELKRLKRRKKLQGAGIGIALTIPVLVVMFGLLPKIFDNENDTELLVAAIGLGITLINLSWGILNSKYKFFD